jgi:transcriptional regulator with XRE-family HTH domain
MSFKRIGTVIRKLREQRQVSQRDLAEKVGVTQAYVAQLESGRKKNPSLEVLNRLAKALGVPVGELLK